MSLADYQSLVAALVRDDRGLLSAGDIDVAIGLAVTRYSTDRPRTVVEDVTAVAADSNQLDLPVGWEVDFSRLSDMEFPVGEWPVSRVEAHHYELYQAPGGLAVVLDFYPGAEQVRLSFSARHVLSAAADTIPDIHREAVSCWAAAFLCDQLASFYAGESDSTIAADHVQDGSQSRDFAFRAKTLRARYLSEIGVDEKRSAPAGAVVDMDLSDSRGRDRLTHPNRYR